MQALDDGRQPLCRSAGRKAEEERFSEILARPHLKIERIVSAGQASPPGFWYDQPWDEWAALLAGAARLRFENEAEARELSAGDHVAHPRPCAPPRRLDEREPARPVACGSFRAGCRRRPVKPPLTLATRNKVTPVNGFSPFFPHLLKYRRKRLAGALNPAIALVLLGKTRSRREFQRGCGRCFRNLRRCFMVTARNKRTVN